MIERDLQEWEEYDARLSDDIPVAHRAPATQQTPSGFRQASFETHGALESPFLLGNAAETAAGTEGERTVVQEPETESEAEAFYNADRPESLVDEGDGRGWRGESFEFDPYAAIRPAMSPEHANLPADEVTLILGHLPASVVLHQLLNSPEMQQATVASILGSGARRSVKLNGSDVSIPAYLRMVSRLCGEVAEQTETPRTSAVAVVPAPKPAAGTSTPDPRPDGIDVYELNDLPSWSDIRAAGITFLIHKSGDGTNVKPDTKFSDRYRDTRANGFIRGSFHYYRHTHVPSGGTVQANNTVDRVHRLGPGDLAPALDFEVKALGLGAAEPTATVWRAELESYLDTLETKLGRIPMIYTRTNAWSAHLSGKPDYRAADFSRFGDYPLWVIYYALAFDTKTVTVQDKEGHDQSLIVHFDADSAPARKDFPEGPTGDSFYRKASAMWVAMAWAGGERLYSRRLTANPPATAIPAPWRSNWFLFQYTQYTPSSMQRHGFTRDYKVDFDVTNGGIHVLRGGADLGHTAPHRVGNLNCIVYGEPDGRVHLLEYLSGRWVDDIANNISANISGTLPLAVGDPTAVGLGNEQVIAYRSVDGRVHALMRNIASPNASWQVVDITGISGIDAFGDPCVLVFQNAIHLVYWGENDTQVHVSCVNGRWQAESFVDQAAGNAPSRISGSAASYVHQNAFHVVSRSRDAGHLFDFTAPNAAPLDLTAASHDANGHAPPAATYRPATYTRRGQAPRIAFRALRGHIWQIERDTLNATNLSAAANAPNAAGSPTAVAADTVHILYRGIDGRINEIFDDGGAWRTRQVCSAAAASDPTAYIADGAGAAATFRKLNGGIHIARFVNGAWTCEDPT
jgi:GH25 family lysozyme M1 (1,4-beta-N-acetylmuramidase)